MTAVVVDSSVVMKWFVPEVLSTEAVRLRDSGQPLHAPDFLDVEIANITWKKVRRGLVLRADADFVIAQLPALPLVRHATQALVSPAFDLADPTGRSVYDCLYLALAVRLSGQMVTSDEKLVNSLMGTPWASSMMHLRDVP
jgi:predicted nucleic acid-binding protein